MYRSTCLGVALAASLGLATQAEAHAIAGARVFPVTLTLDDPGVADEASLPSFSYSRSGANGGPGPSHAFGLGVEYDKTITPRFGVGINAGWDINQTDNAKTQTGFEDLSVTLKDTVYISAEHEFITTIGLAREFGGIGTSHTGADRYGTTSPIGYFGKGLGDLPIGLGRPLAITGEFSYTFGDKGLKAMPAALPSTGGLLSTQFNAGAPNQWSGGLSVQYSMPYLQGQVRDFELPEFINSLVPLVELSWTSPATSPSGQGTTYLAAPGVIYMADSYEVGLELLVPLNRAAGTNVGAVALFHVFLDDLLPNSLGKPLFE